MIKLFVFVYAYEPPTLFTYLSGLERAYKEVQNNALAINETLKYNIILMQDLIMQWNNIFLFIYSLLIFDRHELGKL